MQSPPRSDAEEEEARGTDYIPLGIFCLVVGLGAIFIARDYAYGTLTAMGPGFVPTAIAGLLAFLGALILFLRGRDGASLDGDELVELPDVDPLPVAEEPDAGGSFLGVLRVMIMILGSIAVFGYGLRFLGLALSTFAMVVIASYARRDAELVPTLAIAVGLSIFACVLFVTLLGLNLTILPSFL